MKKNKKRKFGNLFKKLKKTTPGFHFMYIVVLVLFIMSVILLTYSLTLLNGKSADSNSLDHPQTSIRLENISKEWREAFKPAYLSIISTVPDEKSCEKINREVDSYVNDINEMVASFSIYMQEEK